MDETPTATAAALALDLSGHTHIAYSENPVLYATNASGSWSAEPLERKAAYGRFSDMTSQALSVQ